MSTQISSMYATLDYVVWIKMTLSQQSPSLCFIFFANFLMFLSICCCVQPPLIINQFSKLIDKQSREVNMNLFHIVL